MWTFSISKTSGAFYTELNATIVLSANKSSSTSKRLSQVTVATTIDMANNCHRHNPSISTAHLLSSARIAYICNGKLAAFIVAWNLIMEYIVIVALISKALIIYIDALIYGSVGHLTQIVTMVWPFGQYFDVLAMLVPIAIGGKILLFARSHSLHFTHKLNYCSTIIGCAAPKYHFQWHINRIEYGGCSYFPDCRHFQW